jgi:ADP-heptose:LPS heptosyltransferase
MKNKHLLVYRFSAMGDVALTVPAIKSVLNQNPNIEITFITRDFFVPFFYGIDRLNVVGIDINNYKGYLGLRKLYKELKKDNKFDAICDLHDVLRTNILNTFFKLSGTKVFKIDKGRAEKKSIIKSKRVNTPLKHSVERYLDVFKQAGINTTLIDGPWITPNPEFTPTDFIKLHNLTVKDQKWIGIAPFAKHETKIWEIDKVEQLIEELLKGNSKIFFFGGGEEELEKLTQLKAKYPSVIIASKELNFKQELAFIPSLDVMVTMDSSNMHIASLLGVKVVSIWGSTHPSLGFSPLGNEQNIVQLPNNELNCQPCSVFGNIPCSRGDHACMKGVSIQAVLTKIRQ